MVTIRRQYAVLSQDGRCCFGEAWGLKGGAMSTLRVCFWSIVTLILLTAVAWSFLVIFLQTVSVSVVRVEKQLQEGFNPIHLGQKVDLGSLPRVGIPLQPNSGQRIGGKDLAEWLEASRCMKNDSSPVNQLVSAISRETDTDLRVLPLSNTSAETTLPIGHHGSGTVIVLIAIPTDRSGSLSVQWETETNKAATRNMKPAAIPAFGNVKTIE
jgi:hypothetical protein